MNKKIEPKPYHNPITIGLLLRAKRKGPHAGLAEELGYSHTTVLSMVEHGRLNVPQQRIFDFAKAYGLDSVTGMGILKALYPDTYSFVLEGVTIASGEEAAKELDAKVEKRFHQVLLDHHLIDAEGRPLDEENVPLEGHLFPRRIEGAKRGRAGRKKT